MYASLGSGSLTGSRCVLLRDPQLPRRSSHAPNSRPRLHPGWEKHKTRVCPQFSGHTPRKGIFLGAPRGLAPQEGKARADPVREGGARLYGGRCLGCLAEKSPPECGPQRSTFGTSTGHLGPPIQKSDITQKVPGVIPKNEDQNPAQRTSPAPPPPRARIKRTPTPRSASPRARSTAQNPTLVLIRGT